MIKNYYFIILLLASFSNFAQKVIAEVNFSKEKVPLEFVYLPNLDHLVVQSGQKTKKVYGNIIKDVSSYDTAGFVEKIISNDTLVNCVFSPIESAFLIAKKPVGNNFPEEYKLVLDGQSTKYFKLKSGFRYFNDIYGFNISNQKNEYKIDLQNDDLNLEVLDIFSNRTQKYKLEKPNLSRLENKVTTTYKEGLNFDVRINEDNIGIITKSINKNYKSATLYRTIYDLSGVRINDLSYIVSVPSHYLIYSNNGGGVITQNGEESRISDLAINNFVIDKETGDLFVYGLYGNEGKSANYLKNIPLGVYVFKFDKRGKQVWESTQEIADITGFNQLQEIQNIQLSLKIRKNDVLVSVSSVANEGYLDFIILDLINGEKVNNGKLKVVRSDKKAEENIIKTAELEFSEIQNKNLDKETIIASQINNEIMLYLKSASSNKRLFFKTFISKKGFWLVETDSLGYYKIMFFS
ncbi:hypothetical protein EQG63_07650 [Flavobacterium amnicola]|uniref:Uncharacterized protein n=1 Tax=Flavobacterium amnicola TaxID=2506422 RepID=A0A4V1N203_9FLAO|nr:hypothetical protein [Flavobacterium amnicola]RXR19308.1 hypothetical protein EQG63_07650 [Flavobacterium amnicola]